MVWEGLSPNTRLSLEACGAHGKGSQYQNSVGWTVRGSNPGGGEILPHLSRSALGPPSLLYNGYRVIPGGKAARDVVNHTPHLAPGLKKE
jgi:hypothetical protein